MRRDDLGWLALAAGLVILYSIHLGAAELTPIDESRSGVIVRDCLQGNWVLPRTPEGALAEKPPFYYWAATGFTALAGEGERPMRLPSVVFAFGTLVIVGLLASRISGPSAAVLAVATLGSNVLFTAWARAAMVDMTFTFFFTAALAAYVAARTGRLGPWAAALLCGISIGLAVLTKGPIGFVFAGAIGVVDLLIVTRGRFWTGRGWPAAGFAAAISILVSLIWYLPAALAGGSEFLFTSVLDENVYMPLGISHGIAGSHVKPAGYYLTRQLMILLPVMVLLPEAIRRARRSGMSAEARLLAVSTVAMALVLSAAANKRWYYLLPLQPALSLWIAMTVAPALKEPAGPWLRLPVRLAGGLIALGGLAAASCAFSAGKVLDPEARRLFDSLHVNRGLLAVACVSVSWTGFLMIGSSFGAARKAGIAALVAAVVVTGVRPLVIDPIAGRMDRIRPFVPELAGHVPAGAPIAYWPPGNGYGLDFYWPAVKRGTSADYLLVRQAQIPELPFAVETLYLLRFSSAGRQMALVRRL